jgi:glycosyltransferase involved in cell wall biosynthesis
MNETTGSLSKLTIIIPAYNEEATIAQLVETVMAVSLPMAREVIVIDDCSRDGTAAALVELSCRHPEMRALRNERNRGKGFSIRRGIDEASGDIVLIQDADLEYDPREYGRLLAPILDGHADAVYGSRFAAVGPRRVLYYWHTIGNLMLTMLSNMISNLNLTDMETCYKVFRADIVKRLRLRENRFGFEPEVTFKLSRIEGVRIYEVGISYQGRTYREGKKINWRDGCAAIWVMAKTLFLYLILGQRSVLRRTDG